MKFSRYLLLFTIVVLFVACVPANQDGVVQDFEITNTDSVEPSVTPTITITMTPSVTPTVTETPTLTPSSTPAPVTGIREADQAEIIFIYPGEFIMGITQERLDELLEMKEKEGEYWSEGMFKSAVPQRTVYLDGYWIDKYEVTNQQFAAFLNMNGNQMYDNHYYYNAEENDYNVVFNGTQWVAKSGYESYPVTSVGWHAATKYCEWVGARLPTEAEWEKAARGIDGRDYVWGGEIPDHSMANILPGYPAELAPVGSFPMDMSPYGVMDMTGNVSEWVNDWFYSEYYEGMEYENPQGHQQEYSEHGVKTIRGGHYLSLFTVNGLVYQRFANYPKEAWTSFGFRCAMNENSGVAE